MSEQEAIEKAIKHLEDSLADTIVKSVSTELKTTIKKQIEVEFKEVNKKLDSIDKIVTLIRDELGDDRKDLGAMKTSQASIDQGLKELLDTNNKQTKTIVTKISLELNDIEDRVIDKVTETVPEQAREGVKEYIEMIKPKVVQVVEKSKRSKLFFWRKRQVR